MSVVDFGLVIDTVRDMGLLVSLCTVKRPPDTLGPTGAPNLDPAAFINRPGLVDVACMLAPNTSSFSPRYEQDKPESIAELAEFMLLIDGGFPEIAQSDIAVVDGVIYNIVQAATPSQPSAEFTLVGCRTYEL